MNKVSLIYLYIIITILAIKFIIIKVFIYYLFIILLFNIIIIIYYNSSEQQGKIQKITFYNNKIMLMINII